MTTKGRSNGTTKVATTVAKPRRTKNHGNTKSTSGVRKSTQDVRPRANKASRVQSKPVRSNSDADAIMRAKAETAAARAAYRDIIKEINTDAGDQQRLTVYDWIAVSLFMTFLVLSGYFLGRFFA